MMFALSRYLYLLFDDDNFAHRPDFLFTTEGHLFPLHHGMHQMFGDGTRFSSARLFGSLAHE